MLPDTDPRTVLSAYPAAFQPQAIEPLGSAGGFSGASFWRATTAAGPLCLRRWPAEHPSRERLTFIHAVLRHVHQQGLAFIPAPLETGTGQTFVSHAGHFWELTQWLAGTAGFHTAHSDQKLAAAMRALAQFHTAAATFPAASPQHESSPGLQERLARINELLQSGCHQIAAAITPHFWSELEPRARRLLTLFANRAPAVLARVESAARVAVPMQPCIRDVWHDHVLFTGDAVSGIIDFGALRVESVAADIARLLGSLIGDNIDAWHHGLAAYRAVRPLSPDEQSLVRVFDESAVLLSGMNWLDWLYVQHRHFDDRPRILARLDETLTRLEHNKMIEDKIIFGFR
jgi:Ser/Thr protein kinase RdoA (MazF antagonist)